ncbi:unnamed protein product [Pieris macdunnoughi]|uniref:Alanine--tRNA ligase n=1 Tax=Pieris macdunnoughi TaxID=345717 RepID=A0A821T530_9NEOP|nr:unnamed protein product [Pieris macdunnoughi]
MLRTPVRRFRSDISRKPYFLRTKSSSAYLRKTFIDYFIENHGHKHVKSSSVIPLCDPTVPFVNAGMNQFKGVFLGMVEPPCSRAVNSQKCVRIGGKHNDLDLVGLDGTHHTFFEMLGNWSFGDYYKKDACKMAWDLLLGPYRLKPENLLVTYFGGDVVIGLTEDRECRDIWKEIGVKASHIKDCGAKDNFWEMGVSGPCGPCTEIHYIHPDGSLTEIWNIVFIQCNRETDGKVTSLRRHHVDTGMGLERLCALLQGVPSNYDTDLFRPIITAIEKNSKDVSPYSGSYSKDATLDQYYRRLADHARMISICLADGVFPSTSVNLKQIMKKSYKICSDVFHNPNLLNTLYKYVAESLGDTYPELVKRERDAMLILEHERDSYSKLRSNLRKKWKDLLKQYPEVEAFNDVELAGFALGYKELKQSMKTHNSNTIPGELVFKLYDTHGFQEDIIERIATLNNFEIDKKGFWKLLSQHKARHKTSFKEQTPTKGALFDQALQTIVKNGVNGTDDSPKYKYTIDNKLTFPPLKTKVLAILNENAEWVDFLDPCENRPYYIVTESTNFYTEAGGQKADTGIIKFSEHVKLIVDSVFKIRNFVIHKGFFKLHSDSRYVNNYSDVTVIIDSERRLNLMRNHSGVHLLNAGIRKVLPNSIVCQIGSSVSDAGLSLSLVVYGEKLSQKVILAAQELIRESIKCNSSVETNVIDSTQLSSEDDIMTVPGETYPETGLRVVTYSPPLVSRELCCGTHVPSTKVIGDFCITSVKAANSQNPTLFALTGDFALEARELFCRAEKLSQVTDLADPERIQNEVEYIRQQLATLCGPGVPCGEHLACQKLLDSLLKKAANRNDVALRSIAETEIYEACHEAIREGRRFVVHFLRCSYLMQPPAAALALANTRTCPQTTTDSFEIGSRHLHPNIDKSIDNMSIEKTIDSINIVKQSIDNVTQNDVANGELPAILMGCAGGVIVAVARVPQELVSERFTAEKWLNCILPIFQAEKLPNRDGTSPLTHAQMNATKVSLITCEQMVQDAMRVAIKFAQSHVTEKVVGDGPTEDRQHS